jgi:hypothetical protein
MRIRRTGVAVALLGLALFGGSTARADICQDVPPTEAGPAKRACVDANATQNAVGVCVRQGVEITACNSVARQPDNAGTTHCTSFWSWVQVAPLPPVPSASLCGSETAGSNGVTVCEAYQFVCVGGSAGEDNATASAQGGRARVDATGVRFDRDNAYPCDSLPFVGTCGREHAWVSAATPGDAGATSARCTTLYGPFFSPVPYVAPTPMCHEAAASTAGASAKVMKDPTSCVKASLAPRGTDAPDINVATNC